MVASRFGALREIDDKKKKRNREVSFERVDIAFKKELYKGYIDSQFNRLRFCSWEIKMNRIMIEINRINNNL